MSEFVIFEQFTKCNAGNNHSLENKPNASRTPNCTPRGIPYWGARKCFYNRSFLTKIGKPFSFICNANPAHVKANAEWLDPLNHTLNEFLILFASVPNVLSLNKFTKGQHVAIQKVYRSFNLSS